MTKKPTATKTKTSKAATKPRTKSAVKPAAKPAVKPATGPTAKLAHKESVGKTATNPTADVSPAKTATGPDRSVPDVSDGSGTASPAGAKTPEPISSSTSASPPATRSGGNSAMFGVVVTIAVLGLSGVGAWVTRDQWWPHVEPLLPSAEGGQSAGMMARVNAIEEHIASLSMERNGATENIAFAELQQERVSLTAELSAVMARLEAVEHSLKGVERMADAITVDDEVGATRDTIRDLADRLTKLEAAETIVGEASRDFNSVLDRLQTVEDQARAIKSTAAEDTAALASVQSRMNTIESRPVVSGRSSADSGAAALVLGIGQLRDAVHRGIPYKQDLDVLSSALSTATGDVANATVYLQILHEYAASGVLTLLQLQVSFDDVADAAFDASRPANDNGWLSQTLHQLKGIVRIRDTDASVEPGSVESRIARAEHILSGGDLAGAVQVLSGLDGAAAAAMTDWLAAAQARLAVDDALNRLHTLAINVMIAGQE